MEQWLVWAWLCVTVSEVEMVLETDTRETETAGRRTHPTTMIISQQNINHCKQEINTGSQPAVNRTVQQGLGRIKHTSAQDKV